MIEISPAPATLLLLAPFAGSFAGTLATRLPQKRAVVLGRSSCDRCAAVLGPLELLPLVSWLGQRGRCRHCQGKISALYPIMEILALLLAAWAVSVGNGSVALVSCLLGWILLALSAMDVLVYILNDSLVGLLCAGGVAATLLFASDQLLPHFIAASAGFAILFLFSLAYRTLRGRHGLGLGDVKLIGAAGLWVGAAGVGSVIFIAASAALVFAATLIAAGHRLRPDSMMPFGPFIAFGLWIVWLYGPLQFAWR